MERVASEDYPYICKICSQGFLSSSGCIWLNCVVCGLVAKLCRLLGPPGTVVCQVPLSMGFSKQESWSGLPFPSPIWLNWLQLNAHWMGFFYSLKHWGEYEDQRAEAVTQALGRQRSFHMCVFLRLPEDDNTSYETWTQCFPPEHLSIIFSNHQALQHLILSLGFRPICGRKPHRALRWMEQNGSESEQTKNRSLMRVQDWDHGARGPGRAPMWLKRMTMGSGALWRPACPTVHNSPARKAGQAWPHLISGEKLAVLIQLLISNADD